jgi:hypothetical protein
VLGNLWNHEKSSNADLCCSLGVRPARNELHSLRAPLAWSWASSFSCEDWGRVRFHASSSPHGRGRTANGIRATRLRPRKSSGGKLARVASSAHRRCFPAGSSPSHCSIGLCRRRGGRFRTASALAPTSRSCSWCGWYHRADDEYEDDGSWPGERQRLWSCFLFALFVRPGKGVAATVLACHRTS